MLRPFAIVLEPMAHQWLTLAAAVAVDRHGDYRGDGDDAPALAHLQVGGVEPEIGPVADQRSIEEVPHTLVDVLAEFRDRALRDASEPHRLHQLVHPARRDAADPRLLERAIGTPSVRETMASATSAFSEVLRGSRKPGKYEPCRSFGTRRFSAPSRVFSSRSR
jgi:hypothetical protein